MILVHAADLRWDRLHEVVDRGQLPCFSRLIDQGSISTIDVIGQPAAVVWAGMMTGRLPSGHGIYGEFEVRPDGGGVQPFGATSWQAEPVWQILADQGIPTAIVALPGTVPASTWRCSLAIDERFAVAPPFDTLDWPLPPSCIQPSALRARYRGLRLDPEDLDPEHAGPFPIRSLAYAATIQGLALELASRTDWQFLGVHYPALGDSPEALRFLDMSIERLTAAAGIEVNLLIISASGAMLASGPAFGADRLMHGTRTVDVAATILSIFGLKLAEGDGQSVASVKPEPLMVVSGIRRARKVPGEVPAPPSDGAKQAIEEVQRHELRIEALEAIFVEGAAAAVPAVRAALALMPNDAGLRIALGEGAIVAGDVDACSELGRWFESEMPDAPWGDILAGAALALVGDPGADAHLASAEALGADDTGVLIRLGAIALQRGRMAEATRLYSAALAKAETAEVRAQAFTGLGLATLDNADVAERHLRAALGQVYRTAGVHHQLALLLMRQGRLSEAIQALKTAASLSPRTALFKNDLRRAGLELARVNIGRS